QQAAQTGNGGTLQARRHRPSPDTTLLGYIFSSLLRERLREASEPQAFFAIASASHAGDRSADRTWYPECAQALLLGWPWRKALSGHRLGRGTLPSPH